MRLTSFVIFSAIAVLFNMQSASAQELTQNQTNALKEASEWLSAGQGKTAYIKLAPLESNMAGIPEFDVLYGQSALQADEPSVAAFAFERCLSIQPLNGVCRLGMARSHIALQESSSARNELSVLQQSSPPDQVQQVINKYMDDLAGVDRANQDTRLSSYVQFGLGYDSNINNATTDSTMALPAFGGLEFGLSRDGRATESYFWEGQYNIRYSTPISDRWRFLAEGNIAAKSYFNHHSYNTIVTDASIGLARRANKHQFIVRLLGQNYRLHDKDYRNIFGALGQYSYSVSDRSELTAFAQASRLNYNNNKYFKNNSIRDANRYAFGGTWMQGLANDRAVLYLTGYGGTEKTIKHNAPKSLDYNFVGARAGGMYLLTPRLQFEAGAGVEQRRHRGKDALFLKHRNDTLIDAYAGLNYSVNRKLSLRPQYRFFKNNSNAQLYGYKRHIFIMSVRYEIF